MSTIRFGLYFIPEGQVYTRGSHVVGYDIRAGHPVQPPMFIKPEWLGTAQLYGFHITMTDALDTDTEELPAIIEKVQTLTSCLRPENSYTFTKTRIGFWHEGSNQIVIHLRGSRDVEVLHDMLVTAIHPMASGSEYFSEYLSDKEHYLADAPSRLKKTKLFFSPYVLDEFGPHLTCVSSFEGNADARSTFEKQLEQEFADLNNLTFRRLALVTKKPTEEHYTIMKEFDLS